MDRKPNFALPLHASRSSNLRVSVGRPSKQLPVVVRRSRSASPAHSLTAALGDTRHTNAFPGTGQAFRNDRSVSPRPTRREDSPNSRLIGASAAGKAVARTDSGVAGDPGMDGKGDRSLDFFETDSSDFDFARQDRDFDSDADARPESTGDGAQQLQSLGTRPPAERIDVFHQGEGDGHGEDIDPGEGPSNSQHRQTVTFSGPLDSHRTQLNEGLGISSENLSPGARSPVAGEAPAPIGQAWSDYATSPKAAASDGTRDSRSIQHTLDSPGTGGSRPISDGSLFRSHPELADENSHIKHEYLAKNNPDKLENLLGMHMDYNLRLFTIAAQMEMEEKKKHQQQAKLPGRPKSAGGRSPSKEFGARSGSQPSNQNRRSTSARPVGILRNPNFGPPPSPREVVEGRRRSSSVPNTPRLPSAATFADDPPPIPPLSLHRNLSSVLPAAASADVDRSPSPRARKGSPPTPYPHPLEPSTAAQAAESSDSDNSSGRTLRSASAPGVRTTLAQKDKEPTPTEPHPALRRSVAFPRASIRQSIANPDIRRQSRAVSVSLAADTILALSVRRRYAANGRRVTRLVIPADTELGYPAVSRKMSVAQGRRVSVPTTNPEKADAPEEPANKKAPDFDDAAFFRKLRDAYYTELLGTTRAARVWRRYFSLRTLQRITLVASELTDAAARAEAGISSAPRSPRYLARRGLTETFSEDKMLSHFRVPNQGRARYAWVAWVHRVAGAVDEDNEEFAERMRVASAGGVQQISAVPGGLEFLEGWSAWRGALAAAGVVLCAAAACVAYVLAGPLPAQGLAVAAVSQGELGLPRADAEGRVVAGLLLGLLLLGLGWFGLGLWAVASWIIM